MLRATFPDLLYLFGPANVRMKTDGFAQTALGHAMITAWTAPALVQCGRQTGFVQGLCVMPVAGLYPCPGKLAGDTHNLNAINIRSAVAKLPANALRVPHPGLNGK